MTEQRWILVPRSLTLQLWDADGGHWGPGYWDEKVGRIGETVHLIGTRGFPDRPESSVNSQTWRDLKDVVMILGWAHVESEMNQWERRVRDAAERV